jgi:hypothetical protein
MRNAKHAGLLSALLLWSATAPTAFAQDTNVLHPINVLERRITRDTFKVMQVRGSRRANDRTQRVTLAFDDSSVIEAKFAVWAPNGEVFNNVPRYEMAAYELQKLFLDEPDYVVPPTHSRAFNLDWYRTNFQPDIKPTFGGKTNSVFAVVQYWLFGVTNDTLQVFDLKKFDRDTVYARHLGDLNLLTYLIKHNDSNLGNVLISTNPTSPRLFSVDNGVAFAGDESDRGTAWRDIRVPRVSAATIERLKKITREDLDRALGVLAEWELKDSYYVPVEKTENTSAGRGVRKTDTRLQLGLTRLEIGGVDTRLKQLLKRVEGGRLKTF